MAVWHDLSLAGCGRCLSDLVWFFGSAIVALMLSLIAFLMELLSAGRSILLQIRDNRPPKVGR